MFTVCRALLCAVALNFALSAADWTPRSAAAQAPDVWTALGPAGATIFALERDPLDPRVLLAGTYFGGLYRSADNGSTWANVPAPFASEAIFSVQFDPQRSGTIYVGTFGGGVFRSMDGGRSWIERNDGLQSREVQAVALDPFNSRHLLVATSRGIYQSSTAGDSWTPTSATELLGRSLAFDPQVRGLVYVGTLGRAVHVSIDNGITWQRATSKMKDSNVLSLKYDGAFTLYAATTDGIYQLRKGQSEWEDITGNLNRANLFYVLPHPTRPDMQFAAADTGVFVRNGGEWTRWSELPTRLLLTDPTGEVVYASAVNSGGLRVTADKGKNWVERNEGFQNIFVGAIAGTERSGQSVIHAGSDFGVFSAAASANTWSRQPGFGEAIFALTSGRGPGTLYAGTERAGVWKSTDYGDSWRSISSGMVPPQVYSLAQGFGAAKDVLYAGTSTGIYVSRDRGQKWISATTVSSAFTIAIDQNTPGRVLFGSFGGQVLQSLDDGRTFQTQSDGLPEETIVDLNITFDRTFAVTESGSMYMLPSGNFRWVFIRGADQSAATSVVADPKRPWMVYAGTAGGGVYKSTSAGIEWAKSSEGMSNAYISSVLVSPFDNVTVFAGSKGAVYRSDNEGETWERFTTGLGEALINRLVYSPDGTLYAVSAVSGAFRSTDRGETWEAFGSGLPRPVTAVAIDTGNNDLIVGVEQAGVFRSPNGANWENISNGLALFVRGLAVSSDPQPVLYAGALLGGIFRSDDDGASWQGAGLRNASIFKLAVDPRNRDIVYAATAEGIQKTVDGGANWVPLGQRAAFILSMAVDPRNRNIAFVGTTAGIISRTKDGGLTWETTGKLPPVTVMALAIDPGTGAVFAMLETKGIYRSMDDGKTWALRANMDYLYGNRVESLSVDEKESVLYGASQGGVLRSSDGGSTWLLLKDGLTSTAISSVVVDRTTPARLLASTFEAGVWVSDNGGQSWSPSNQGLGPLSVNLIVQSPDDGQLFYALTTKGMFQSTNGGKSWRQTPNGPTGSILSIVFEGQDGKTLFVGTEADGIWKSTGAGSWTRVNAQLRGVSFLNNGATQGSIYAGTQNGGVVRTTDSGATWQGDTNADVVDPVVLSIVLSPDQPDTIYAGTAGQGVLKSTNGGQDWVLMNAGLANKFLLSLIIDPNNGQRLYAGTSGAGVFVTEDGGATWRALNNRLFSRIVTALALDPIESNVVYAGTEGGGVYRLIHPASAGGK